MIIMMMEVQVEPNDLGNLKDSMEHYLQDAAEPDFVEVLAALPLRLVDDPAAGCSPYSPMTAGLDNIFACCKVQKSLLRQRGAEPTPCLEHDMLSSG